MPAHGLPVVEVDTGTVSKDSTGTQDKLVLQTVLQEAHQVVLQGFCCDCQDRRELQGLQEALGLETVEAL